MGFAEVAEQVESSGARDSFQWGGTIFALILLIMNRVGQRSGMQTNLLVMYLFTSFPRVLFKTEPNNKLTLVKQLFAVKTPPTNIGMRPSLRPIAHHTDQREITTKTQTNVPSSPLTRLPPQNHQSCHTTKANQEKSARPKSDQPSRQLGHYIPSGSKPTTPTIEDEPEDPHLQVAAAAKRPHGSPERPFRGRL